MPYTIACFLWRKPGTTPFEFKSHYENHHIPLLLSVMGPVFPQTHTRFYLTKNATTDDTSSNADYAPTVFMGTREDFDYDLFCELVFEDVKAFEAFFARFREPEVAAKLGEDEERFMDRKMLKAVAVDEPVVTLRPTE